jgi:hypothetical protein
MPTRCGTRGGVSACLPGRPVKHPGAFLQLGEPTPDRRSFGQAVPARADRSATPEHVAQPGGDLRPCSPVVARGRAGDEPRTTNQEERGCHGQATPPGPPDRPGPLHAMGRRFRLVPGHRRARHLGRHPAARRRWPPPDPGHPPAAEPRLPLVPRFRQLLYRPSAGWAGRSGSTPHPSTLPTTRGSTRWPLPATRPSCCRSVRGCIGDARVRRGRSGKPGCCPGEVGLFSPTTRGITGPVVTRLAP